MTELGSIFPDVPRVEGQSIPKAEAVIPVIGGRPNVSVSPPLPPWPLTRRSPNGAADAEAAAQATQDELARFERQVAELGRTRRPGRSGRKAWNHHAAQEDVRRAASVGG